ncbi:MAG: hypothetical protein AB1806_10265 [Acidobacteriota bacterium]
MMVTRRGFVRSVAAAGVGSLTRPLGQLRPSARDVAAPRWRNASSVGAELANGGLPGLLDATDDTGLPPVDLSVLGRTLRARFPDLKRHIIFEYYPWYSTNPWAHWNEEGRNPPVDIAANNVPLLGAYDSLSTAVLEQHARWIAEAGVGAINLSWWGPGSPTDRAVHQVMDVMRAHDVHVAFHLEPYRDDRGLSYWQDISLLVREYGERRRWDCLLLLRDAAGRQGPVFKSFRTILPPTSTDCHGIVHVTRDYTSDSDWRRESDRVRTRLAEDFDRLWLLADSLDFSRVRASGFDGIAIYDNYVRPSTWPGFASACSAHDLVFSFNCNPGFDGIEARDVAPDSCYVLPEFEPPAQDLDWQRVRGRELARRLARRRIFSSLQTTLQLQLDDRLSNARQGTFLVYVNSFNEWHEGTQFEPMKDHADLSPDERRQGYHNPVDGSYRLDTLREHLASLLHG